MSQPHRDSTQPVRSQAELAELVGYSRVTVSKALSGHPGVLPETRQKIVRKAEEVGYRPSAAARAMRSGRLGQVALVCPVHPPDCYMPPALLRGLHRALCDHDMLMLLAEVDGQLSTAADVDHQSCAEELPRLLREVSVDGLLVEAIHASDQLRQRVNQMHLPAIWLNGGDGHDCVSPDCASAGRIAADHFWSLGHRHVGVLSFPSPWAPHADRRIDAFAQAIRQRGGRVTVPPDSPRPMREASVQIRQEAAGALLDRDDRPTAVLADGNAALCPLFSTAAARGLALARDLSVVVLDDRQPVEMAVDAALLRIPYAQVGAEACRMLIDRLSNGDQPLESRSVPFEPIEPGATCGPPGN